MLILALLAGFVAFFLLVASSLFFINEESPSVNGGMVFLFAGCFVGAYLAAHIYGKSSYVTGIVLAAIMCVFAIYPWLTGQDVAPSSRVQKTLIVFITLLVPMLANCIFIFRKS